MAEKKNAKKVVVHEVCVEGNHNSKKCPIKEHIERRLEELDGYIDNTLNPLDKLEQQARYDELSELRNWMSLSSIRNAVGEALEKDSESKEEA